VSAAMMEVNGSIDALFNSPEVFFEVANDLSTSLSESLADDDTQLASVVKALFDVVSLFQSYLISYYVPAPSSHKKFSFVVYQLFRQRRATNLDLFIKTL